MNKKGREDSATTVLIVIATTYIHFFGADDETSIPRSLEQGPLLNPAAV